MLSDMNDQAPAPDRGARISTDLVIETPENVVLTCRLAGPAVRLLAYLVDFMIRAALLLAATWVASWAGMLSMGISMGLLFVAIFIIDWAYFGFFEICFRGK